MDLVYKIYSVYLYDNQLDHNYFILYNRSKRFGSNELTTNFPYRLSSALEDIYKKRQTCVDIEAHKLESIDILKNIIGNTSPIIETKNYLTLVKRDSTHLSNYNIYDIYWNETKSGINLHEYEVVAIWNPGNTSCSAYRIYEGKENKDIAIRNNKLKKNKKVKLIDKVKKLFKKQTAVADKSVSVETTIPINSRVIELEEKFSFYVDIYGTDMPKKYENELHDGIENLSKELGISRRDIIAYVLNKKPFMSTPVKRSNKLKKIK